MARRLAEGICSKAVTVGVEHNSALCHLALGEARPRENCIIVDYFVFGRFTLSLFPKNLS